MALTVLSAILVASSAAQAWATSGAKCGQELSSLLQTSTMIDASEFNQSDLSAAPLTARSSLGETRTETAIAEKHVGKDKTQGATVCEAITVPSGCSCTIVDQYTSKLTCSKVIQGPTGSNTFTLVADIKPCLGPPTISLTASEANTGNSLQKSITTSDATLGVGVPGLSVNVGVVAVGLKLIATFNDLGNDRLAISFALDGCASVGPWFASYEVCGSKLTSELPKPVFDSPMLNFYGACAGKTADDGAAVSIWNKQLYTDGTGSCLGTSAATGYVYAAACSTQESVWTWTDEHAFKTKKSGKCLDTYVWKDGYTYAKAAACTRNLNQKWDWSGSSITNRATGKCLSVHQASNADWVDIVMQDCAASGEQLWVWSVV